MFSRNFIDLSDVVSHARHNYSVTGIQRVQLEISRALILRGARAFCWLNGSHVDLTHWLLDNDRLTTTALYTAFRHRFGHPNSLQMPARTLRDHYRYAREQVATKCGGWGGREDVFGGSDSLYIGGAFWADNRFLSLIESAVRRGAHLIVFIHDTIPLTFPQFTDGGTRPAFERLFRLPFGAITNSHFSRDDIGRAIESLREAHLPNPIRVVPLAQEYAGVQRNLVAGPAPTERVARLVGGSFALCVGTVDVRKNHAELLRLWTSIAASHGANLPKLVVAGRRGWMAQEALRRLDEADDDTPFLFIEGPSDEELVWLYASCRFTVFPSLAEGWGLPVGESLWFGKPCVASATTSIPEVGGHLCEYGDPVRIETFAAAILALSSDQAFLEARSSQIRDARLRCWSEVSADMADAIEALTVQDPPTQAKLG